MSTIVEVFDRKPHAKSAIALDCIMRFIEVVDSMEIGAIRDLLIELQALPPSDDYDEKLIRAAVVYVSYVATINKGGDDDLQAD